ncbi:MAG TPA: hypothetical protein VJ821_14530 [Anaerolineales bacterium]|nr:hypothetical protein [Anaerolineales bacterium]
MSFFDRFRKSPKQEPARDDPFGSPELQKKRYEAAVEFMKAFQERMPLIAGKPHAGTVLSIPARLAGTNLYRSLNYKNDVAPGVVVLSNEVNEAWPQLMNLFAFYCKQHGLDVLSKPPVTVFPEGDQPRMDVAQVQQEYQDRYDEIVKKHGLDDLDGARAGMIVCSMVFQYHCTVAKDIDPYVAAGIIAMGVVEGAKTAPPPLGSGNSTDHAPEKKIRTENRLVLGERGAATREALDHGGVFIDPNPEVLRMLQAGNIDPYLIYEKTMLDHIEAKIPRIDFVKADVDKLYEEWRSKTHSDAPIHVRLILWLKENARTYGYEQSGNSWVLKG